MCLLVQHNNAGLRVSFSYIRKKPKCRNVEAAGSLKISSTPRDWTVQNADVPSTRTKKKKKKRNTCFLFRCRSTAKETNMNLYTANRKPCSRAAITMLKIQGAADKSTGEK